MAVREHKALIIVLGGQWMLGLLLTYLGLSRP